MVIFMKHEIGDTGILLQIDDSGVIRTFQANDHAYIRKGTLPVVRLLYSDAASMWEASDWQELSHDNITVEPQKDGLELVFTGFEGKNVSVVLSLTVAKNEIKFDTKVIN